MIFWLAALGLTLACVLLVLLPLRRTPPAAELDPVEVNTRIFRERLGELDSDRDSGRIDADEYAALRLELERALLSDLPAEGSATGSRAAAATATIAVVLAVSVPLAGLAYFYLHGYLGAVQDWRETRFRLSGEAERLLRDPDAPVPDALAGDLPNLVRVLMTRVQRDGLSDGPGLGRLGTTLLQAGAYEEALDVLNRAYRHDPASNQIRVALAQAIVMNNEGRLDARSEQLLAAVLDSSPDHQGARMLLGFAAYNAGRFETAIEAWRTLLEGLAPGSEAAAMLREVIARAEAGRAAGAPPMAPDAAPPSAGITVTVDISDEMRGRLEAGHGLFVFAREAGGPAVPLAAVRQAADGFPVTVVLDDSTGMLPGRTLSGTDTVEVLARISATAQGGSGDLEAAPVTVDMRHAPAQTRLLIDRIRP